MYEKNKNNRITLRLSDKQMEFISLNASIMQVSPSEFLRMMLNSFMVVSKNDNIKEGCRRENEETNIDN